MSRAYADRSPMRWGVAALLFAATAINYIDRQTHSVVAPYIWVPISFASYRWQKHCRGLYQTPIAA